MGKTVVGHKKLRVWERADEFAFEVYKETKGFPEEELYGMTSQFRKAAPSVPTNIVEGCARQGKREVRQFANIALGSLGEVRYLLDFSFRMKYLSEVNYKRLEGLGEEVGKLLWKFYKAL